WAARTTVDGLDEPCGELSGYPAHGVCAGLCIPVLANSSRFPCLATHAGETASLRRRLARTSSPRLRGEILENASRRPRAGVARDSAKEPQTTAFTTTQQAGRRRKRGQWQTLTTNQR